MATAGTGADSGRPLHRRTADGGLGAPRGLRGGRFVVPTRPTAAVIMPDLVDRHFAAIRPNQLWVSDFTYVATAEGVVCTACD